MNIIYADAKVHDHSELNIHLVEFYIKSFYLSTWSGDSDVGDFMLVTILDVGEKSVCW